MSKHLGVMPKLRVLKGIIGWFRVVIGHAPSLPKYWLRHFINVMMWALPDDQLSAVMRARLLKLGGAKVGKGAMVRQGARFGGFNLSIGEFASIGSCCHLDSDGRITMGSYAALSPKVVIVTASHSLDGTLRRTGEKAKCLPVTIGDGAWVGCGSIVLPGVTIGRRSVVAAGAVVHRDVPDNALVAGVPAKVVRILEDLPRQANEAD